MGGADAYREAQIVDAEQFIAVKGLKAKGKRLTTYNVATITELEPLRFKPIIETETETAAEADDVNEDDENESKNEIAIFSTVENEITETNSNEADFEDEYPEMPRKPVSPKKPVERKEPTNDDSEPEQMSLF
jgi:topoisomerase-4 subunit A